MSTKVNYITNIHIQIPYDLILIRLGYKKNKTKILDYNKEKLFKLIDKSAFYCQNTVAYRICRKLNLSLNKIKINNKFYIKSSVLFNLLKDCSEILLMAATVGNEIIEKRDYEIRNRDHIFGLVLDAVGSEITDALLDWVENYLKIQLARQNKLLTRRFSPGYGDLNLSIQKKIYDYLKLSKIKIKINKKNILIPEKSVIAIAGIKNFKEKG